VKSCPEGKADEGRALNIRNPAAAEATREGARPAPVDRTDY